MNDIHFLSLALGLLFVFTTFVVATPIQVAWDDDFAPLFRIRHSQTQRSNRQLCHEVALLRGGHWPPVGDCGNLRLKYPHQGIR